MRQSQGAGWAATRVGYTEFSFGYAFTENLIRGSATALTGAPVFPTLVQEAILGYDGQISFPAAPLFFQYKLPELMTRASASEIANGLCPSLLQAPGVVYGAWSILDALPSPTSVGTSLIFKQLLGRVREVVDALSGLFGRFVPRVYLLTFRNRIAPHEPILCRYALSAPSPTICMIWLPGRPAYTGYRLSRSKALAECIGQTRIMLKCLSYSPRSIAASIRVIVHFDQRPRK